ncbi:hypothetical protein BJ742DRAFT_820863 [Cladochytrium replicatum]|nr:hypothetical protein BJ742DRAFT_820863 [Cladochytrium replicatum]
MLAASLRRIPSNSQLDDPVASSSMNRLNHQHRDPWSDYCFDLRTLHLALANALDSIINNAESVDEPDVRDFVEFVAASAGELTTLYTHLLRDVLPRLSDLEPFRDVFTENRTISKELHSLASQKLPVKPTQLLAHIPSHPPLPKLLTDPESLRSVLTTFETASSLRSILSHIRHRIQPFLNANLKHDYVPSAFPWSRPRYLRYANLGTASSLEHPDADDDDDDVPVHTRKDKGKGIAEPETEKTSADASPSSTLNASKTSDTSPSATTLCSAKTPSPTPAPAAAASQRSSSSDNSRHDSKFESPHPPRSSILSSSRIRSFTDTRASVSHESLRLRQLISGLRRATPENEPTSVDVDVDTARRPAMFVTSWDSDDSSDDERTSATPPPGLIEGGRAKLAWGSKRNYSSPSVGRHQLRMSTSTPDLSASSKEGKSGGRLSFLNWKRK